MNQQIEKIKKLRAFVLDAIKDLSTEQLNIIPPGHNNNIIWNLAHMVAVQQAICYLRASLPPVTEQQMVNDYKSGTKPAEPVDEAGIRNIKALMLSSLDKLEEDHDNNLFANYTSWNNRYDVMISTIDEAIDFLLFHEGYHIGTIIALKKYV
ncbi:MAG: DinB family protein [Flavitalea sp.]